MKYKFLKRLLSSLIAFQLAAAPFTTTYVRAADENKQDTRSELEKQLTDLTKEGSDLPAARKAQAKAEQLATEIENAKENDSPKNMSNAFFLAEQMLSLGESGKSGTYNLSRFNLALPTVSINDFAKEITVEVSREEKTISFVKYKGEHEVARHTIRGLDVVSFAREAELLQMVGADGRIYAIDLAFTSSRHVIFKTPIPIFTVGTVPEVFVKDIEHIKCGFITRGIKPPTWVHPEALIPVTDKDLFEKNKHEHYSSLAIKPDGQWQASPFILYNEKDTHSDRELLGIYHRDVTMKSVQMGFGVLNSLAYVISPEGQADSAVALLANSNIALAASQINNQINELTRNAISAYTPEIVTQTIVRTNTIERRINDPKDKFLFREWNENYSEYYAKATQEEAPEAWKAAAAKGNLGEYLEDIVKDKTLDINKSEKNMFQRLVSKNGLKNIALITASYGALVGSHLYGGALVDGNGPAWAVHAASTLYNILPDVLQDAAYRVTMFKGTHALASLLLVNYVVGTIYGKARGWDFKKALATIGIRIAAQIQFSFLARIAQLTRQSSFITALRSGTNPFSKIRANSAVGKMAGLTEDTYAGLNNPFASKEKKLSDSEKKRAVLEAKITVDRRRNATAGLLANLVVAEKFGIDPVTLLMAQRGDLDGDKLDELYAEINRLKRNPLILKKWKTLSEEVYFSLKALPDFKDDISNIKRERLVVFYQMAKKTAEAISKRKKFARVAAKLKNRWQEMSQGRGLKAIGNFGHTEFEFLNNVEPTKFVSEQSWEQFLADFYLTVIQVPLVGDRANVGIPHELAHQEGRFMWTSPGHMADMGNQYAIYGVTVPARTAQVYGDAAIQVRENRYDPIEMLTLTSITKPEGFFRGMWSWMKGAGNLTEAGYGFIFVKDFMRRLRAIQLTFSMDIFCRIFIANQAGSSALPAFLYFLLMAEWSYAWFWKPVTRGNQIYKDGLDKINEEFMNAKINISQGIRLKNEALWRDGFDKLLATYSKHTTIEETSSRLIDKIERLLAIPDLEKIEPEIVSELPFMLTLKLRSAIQTGDKGLISLAYNELKKVYQGENYQVSSLDAQELLEFSLQHPPFYNATNSKVSNVTNIVASLVTTYLGTNLFVDLLRDHSWSDKIASGATISISMYVLVYNLQKAINNLSQTTEYIRLRAALPLEAFDEAHDIRPKMKSLEDYAKWLKEQPETSQVIRDAPAEVITSVLKEEINSNAFGNAGLLHKINSAQKPSIQEIKTCASLLKPTEPTPMSTSQKIMTLIKGVFSPPTK